MDVNSEVLELASQFFCPELQSRIPNWVPEQVYDLSEALKGAVFEISGSRIKITWWPTTVMGFFNEIAPAFSAEYMDWRYTAYANFQASTKDEDPLGKFGDAIIQNHNAGDWILTMTHEIARSAIRLGRSGIPQLDGSFDAQSPSSTLADVGSITQLTISGPTVKAA